MISESLHFEWNSKWERLSEITSIIVPPPYSVWIPPSCSLHISFFSVNQGCHVWNGVWLSKRIFSIYPSLLFLGIMLKGIQWIIQELAKKILSPSKSSFSVWHKKLLLGKCQDTGSRISHLLQHGGYARRIRQGEGRWDGGGESPASEHQVSGIFTE